MILSVHPAFSHWHDLYILSWLSLCTSNMLTYAWAECLSWILHIDILNQLAIPLPRSVGLL